MDCLCVGHSERVPFVRHDLYMDEWRSIGMILRFGFEVAGFFPVQLSKAFLMHCLFDMVPNDVLIESFLLYIPLMDSDMVTSALKANLDTIQSDDFANFLERYICRSLVTPLNVYGTIRELAQQELIQKPYLMVSVWREILLGLQKYKEFSCPDAVQKFYEQVKPTNRKVLKLLKANPQTKGERDSMRYFEEYIRGLDKKELIMFLKYLTGSTILNVKSIEVHFNELTGAKRHPFVRTNTPMIELPSTYCNVCELKEEFSNMLNPFFWEFDTS